MNNQAVTVYIDGQNIHPKYAKAIYEMTQDENQVNTNLCYKVYLHVEDVYDWDEWVDKSKQYGMDLVVTNTYDYSIVNTMSCDIIKGRFSNKYTIIASNSLSFESAVSKLRNSNYEVYGMFSHVVEQNYVLEFNDHYSLKPYYKKYKNRIDLTLDNKNTESTFDNKKKYFTFDNFDTKKELDFDNFDTKKELDFDNVDTEQDLMFDIEMSPCFDKGFITPSSRNKYSQLYSCPGEKSIPTIDLGETGYFDDITTLNKCVSFDNKKTKKTKKCKYKKKYESKQDVYDDVTVYLKRKKVNTYEDVVKYTNNFMRKRNRFDMSNLYKIFTMSNIQTITEHVREHVVDTFSKSLGYR